MPIHRIQAPAAVVGCGPWLKSAIPAGRVVICSYNDQVRRVLEITGLELSIAIHGTRDEALTALRG